MIVRLAISSIFIALLVACSKKAPDGADAAPAAPAAADTTPAAAVAAVSKVSCADRSGGSMMLSWKECSDGINRTIGCDKKNDKVMCECRENDVVKKTFDATTHYKKDPTPFLPSHSPEAIVEQHCGWVAKR